MPELRSLLYKSPAYGGNNRPILSRFVRAASVAQEHGVRTGTPDAKLAQRPGVAPKFTVARRRPALVGPGLATPLDAFCALDTDSDAPARRLPCRPYPDAPTQRMGACLGSPSSTPPPHDQLATLALRQATRPHGRLLQRAKPSD